MLPVPRGGLSLAQVAHNSARLAVIPSGAKSNLDHNMRAQLS